jgi:hypothetical protein
MNRYSYLIFIIYIVLAAWCFVFISGCANVVAPTGGPKDTKPPVAIKFVPANNSLNFKEEEIRIYFDEFVRVNSIDNNAIISPPVDKAPDFSIKGKSLIIKLKGKLKDSVTYSILLNNCIADITEGNINTDLQYVFSTGPFADSLIIKGNVIDAFTLKPEKDLLVMLYKINETKTKNDTIPIDSLPYKQKPLYVTKTNADGNFTLRNLREASYKIFVLKDMNSDLLYNMRTERIAFIDSLVIPEVEEKAKPDTLKKAGLDSLYADSLKYDSEDSIKSKHTSQTIYNLRLFQEVDTLQKILKPFTLNKRQFIIPFKYPTKNVQLSFLNSQLSILNPQYSVLKEFSRHKDSLMIWLLNFDKDSIYLAVKDNSVALDTVKLNMVQKSKIKKLSKTTEKLSIKINAVNNAPFDYYKPLKLVCNTPIKEYDFSKVYLIEGKDTVKTTIDFYDSLKRRIEIKYAFKEKENYKLFIKPSAFRDIYEIANDTIKLAFTIKPAKSFGKIIINADFIKNEVQRIIQLLDEKDNIVYHTIVKGKENIRIANLNPAKYRLKMIYDENNNGKWDTGNYLKKIQPEKVSFYSKEIVTKANWEVAVDWKD